MFNHEEAKYERPIDNSISTATLAGIDEKQSGHPAATGDVDDAVESRYSESTFDSPQTPLDANIPAFRSSSNGIETPNDANVAAFRNQDEIHDESAPLFPASEATELRGRWHTIQVGFVDEPRHAVEQADALVAGAMKRMAEIFAEERSRLEGQWDRGDAVSTEDLRLALRRYRSFFGRVLSM